MVVLAASICTRGGKAVLSRQFREMQRSRVEGLLASFPKLADSGTQHTTVEQDNVRYVYQPLDELYMVLITNRQSNILQDIDSLHLFAQVVTSICKSLDEREILRNAFELLSAFDELVTLGYRENLTITQIKTFLEMESHEERVAIIIEQNKQLEATEQRKLKAKQLEMQRREQTRATRNQAPIPKSYPTYTTPVQPSITEAQDSYAAEKNRNLNYANVGAKRTDAGTGTSSMGKGMQLGKKSRSTNMFDQVKGDIPLEEAPLVPPLETFSRLAASVKPSPRTSTGTDRESIHVTLAEAISAKLTRDGAMESFEVKGDLHLRISDSSVTQVKLDLDVDDSRGAQFMTHPKVDKPVFTNSKVIQLKEASRGFPVNNPIQVMRWRWTAKSGESADLPLTLTAWVNQGSDGTYSVTVEYELTGNDTLRDVVVTIPYTTSEPSVSSFDAVYEISGDSIDWTIGTIDEENPTGSFDFEAQADHDEEFFPMSVSFSKTKPFVDVKVSSVSLLSMSQDLPFSTEVRSVAEKYLVS